MPQRFLKPPLSVVAAINRVGCCGDNLAAGTNAIHKRLVIELIEFQGLKYREAAETLGIPVGTVKSRMAAAEKDLKEMLYTQFQENGLK